MKPKFRSLIATFAPLTRSSLIVCASFCAAASVHAASQTWTGATDGSWGVTTNWSGDAIPGSTDTATFDNSSANITSIALGANRILRDIRITDTTGDVTIVAGSALTLIDGIDMTTAANGFNVNCTVALGSNAAASNAQTWNVASGKTLALAAIPSRYSGGAGATDLRVGGVLNLPGAGTTKFGTVAAIRIADVQGNPFVTINTNDWTALAADGTVITATYDNDLFTNNSNIVTAGTYSINGAGPNSVRFANTTGEVIVNNSNTSTLRGLLMTTGAQNVTLNGGFIRPNRSNTAGATFSIIQNSTSGDMLINSALSNASSSTPVSYTKSGPGKVITTGGTGSGLLFIHQGTWQFGNGGTAGGFNSTNTIINNASLVVDRSDTIWLTNSIQGTGSLTKNGAGTLNLGTTSTYTGSTIVNAGLISIGGTNSFGATSGLTLNGGGIQWNANTADITALPVTIGGSGATFDTNGNNVTFASAFASGSSGSLTKNGVGSLTLSATNDYSGGTTVNAGKLLVSATNATGTGNVTVNTGASIGGSGTIAGTLNVTSGADLTPGASVGTLTTGGLSLQAGSTATFEFDSGNDQVAVSTSGGLTINGGAITLLNASALPFTTPGTYTLITYSGTLNGAGASALSVANPQAGFGYTFNNTGSAVTLTIATTGLVANWNVDSDGNWGTGGNWNPSQPNGAGETAIFGLIATAPRTITLDASKTVGAITFGNANGYTIVPAASQTLTINNNGDPGAINNNGGAHAISANINLVSNLGLSSATAAESTTFGGVISGSGSITKPGPGQLFLLGNNTFSGNLNLSGGTTTFASGGLGLGSTLNISAATLRWASGNTQDISNRFVTFGTNPVTFDTNGNNVLLANSIGEFGSSPFTKAGLGTLTLAEDPFFSSDITISGGVLQLGTGSTTSTPSSLNIINNGGLVTAPAIDLNLALVMSGTGSLTHQGPGLLTLPNANTFSGVTSVGSGATIAITDSLALQSSTLSYSSSGGSLNVGTLTAVTLGGLSGDKNLDLINDTLLPVALTVGGNNSTSTYSGILSGAGASLRKEGTGTLTLQGANTYDGLTYINTGILEVATGGVINTLSAGINEQGGGSLIVNGGSVTTTGATLFYGGGTNGIFVNSGTANFDGGMISNNNDGSHVVVNGGVLNTTTVELRRTASGGNAAAPTTVGDSGLQILGGTMNLSGALNMATSNSSATSLVNGGSLNIAGPVNIGMSAGSDRWSTLEVRSGTFTNTDTIEGVVISQTNVNKGQFLVTGGIATVEKLTFGGSPAVPSTSFARLTVTSGQLYVGSGGMVTNGTAIPEIHLKTGTVAAKAAWSTSLPVNLTGADYTEDAIFKAADFSGNPFDITLNGPVTGTGGINKIGDGTLTLTGARSYAEETWIDAGTLSVTSSGFSDTALVQINQSSGAVLNLNFAGGDKVKALWIDGFFHADEFTNPGSYGAIGSGADFEIAGITGTGLLYVGVDVPAGYTSWAATNAGGQTSNLDFDLDGVSNGVEYFMGTTGSSFTSNPGLVGGTVTWPNGGNINSSAYGTEFVVQTSPNLNTWTDVLIGNPNLSNTAGSVSYTPPTGAGKTFTRLKVTPN